MSTFKITIPGTPKPKESVRLSRWSKKCYSPSARGMEKMRQYVRENMGTLPLDGPMLTGPLLVIIHFRLPAPKTFTLAKRKAQNCLPHIVRPDGDNLEKFVNDALNGLVWKDDANICWMLRSKSITFEKEGSTSIFVRELGTGQPDYNQILTDIREHLCYEVAA